MICSSCGQMNAEGAAFCQRCGMALTAERAGPHTAQAEPAGGPPLPGQTHPPGQEMRVSERGRSFAIGYGPGYFAVWDLRSGGPPVQTFERTQPGWETAWRAFQRLEKGAYTPDWRQLKAGWVLLHVAIAFAIWFGLLFVAAGIAVSAHRSLEDITDASGLGALGLLVACLVAWIQFVYTRSPSRTRWTTLLVVLGATLAAFIAILLASQPPVLG